jgi:hypothetical protein
MQLPRRLHKELPLKKEHFKFFNNFAGIIQSFYEIFKKICLLGNIR